ncbi:MAG: LamG-like jellyroll fold domain-containing protein [Candidatus Liptonbacteria bacterium]|nr:LamG-like jellyroll fold domain-containing protein [Candidatus Liptonbacteria bacterium]
MTIGKHNTRANRTLSLSLSLSLSNLLRQSRRSFTLPSSLKLRRASILRQAQDHVKDRRSFTLIELLIVIAILSILAIAVIITINPSELLKQGRDSTRLSDVASINSALNIYQTDSAISDSSSFGTASTTYISIPDPTATSTLGDQCQGLGLPALPSGYTYHCSASSTYRNVDGTGWLPVNFSSISYGSPLGVLPVDPVNTTSSGNYYTYTPGGSWQLTATPESNKVRTSNQVDSLTGAITAGNDLSLSPLFNPSGLVGYWKFDEGSGTSTVDSSGNNNSGRLISSPAWRTSSSCKEGGCLFFNGTSYVTAADSNSLNIQTNAFTISAWLKPNVDVTSMAATYPRPIYKIPWLVGGYDAYLSKVSGAINTQYSYLSGSGNTSSAKVLSGGTWYHYTGTFDGNKLRTYVNGILENTSGVLTNPMGSSAGTALLIGWTVEGIMDDVRVYNRALSAAEIYALYSATR